MAIPASVSDFLDRHHARYSVLRHPVAYTAQEEAAAAQVPGHDWAKVVVCVADERPLLAVLPAPLKVDVTRLKDATHASALRIAREHEFKNVRETAAGALTEVHEVLDDRQRESLAKLVERGAYFRRCHHGPYRSRSTEAA